MFKVNPEALRDAAHDYTVSANHVAVAANYHRKPSEVEFFEGSLFGLMEPAHTEFVTLLQERLDQAAMVLADSAIGLQDAATHYESTDAESARRTDAIYPHIPRIDSELGSGR